MSNVIEIPRELLERLVKDPDFIKKALRSNALDSFKSKYGVEHASGLKCPGCLNPSMGGGSLWGPKKGTENEYVCRRCLLQWKIDCLTRPTSEVIKEVKGK